MHEFEIPLPHSHLCLKGIKNFNGERPDILAFHGWLDNCHSFLPMLPHLKDFNVMAIDFPGHGLSEHYAAGQVPYFHDLIYCIREIFECLDLESCHIMGHSMGGGAASLFAGVFPELVRSLILLDSLGPISTPEQGAPEKMKQAISTWLRHGKRPNPIYDDHESASKTRMKSGMLTIENSRILTQRGVKKVEKGVKWAHDPKLKLPSPGLFSEAQVDSYLKAIESPTLLIQGKSSFLAKSQVIPKRMAHLRQAVSTTLDAGHHVHMDLPEETAQIVRNFLSYGSI